MTKPNTSISRATNPRTKRPRRMARPPEVAEASDADASPAEAVTMMTGAASDPCTGESGARRVTTDSTAMDAPSALAAQSAPATICVPIRAAPAPQTKAALVLDLLRRSEGATLAELTAATGWQPHTVRAHLTGLRKKGNVIAKAQRGDTTCYHIAEAL